MKYKNTLQGHTSHDDSYVYLSFWLKDVAQASQYSLAFHRQPIGKKGTASGKFTLCTDLYTREYLEGKELIYNFKAIERPNNVRIPCVAEIEIKSTAVKPPNGMRQANHVEFTEFIAAKLQKHAHAKME